MRVALTTRSVGLGLAISLTLVATWLMNVTAYPGFNDFAPWARDVATTFGGVWGIGLALYARHRPYGFTGVRCLVVCLLFMVVAPATMLLAIAQESAVLAVVGSCGRTIGRTFVTMYMCCALMRQERSERLGALACAYCLYYLLMGLCEGLSGWVLSLLFVAAPVVGAVALYLQALPQLRAVVDLDTEANLSPTNPSPFLPLTHQVFVAAFLFQVAMGYAITFGSVASYPQPLLPAFGALVVVFAVLLMRGVRSIDSLYVAAFALALAGFLLAPGALAVSEAGLSMTSNSLCRAGTAVFDIVLWFLIASIGRRNVAGALPLIFTISGVNGFGTEVGATTGHLANYLGMARPDLVYVLMASVVFGFTMYNLVLLRHFSFDRTVCGVQPIEPVRTADENGRDYDVVCARLAAEHGLTAREAEVLPLLARGRNVAYIMEELTLSRNTIKSYVARVYGKLDVHSHQELIDLVEREAGE